MVPVGSAVTGGWADDWKSTSLGELIALRRGHDLTRRQRRDGYVPVMGSAGQNGFHSQAIAPGPGVVLGRSGASFGQAHSSKVDYWPHNTALYVTDFNGNDHRFVYYLLSSIDFSSHNTGGAQQSLNRNFIATIALSVPGYEEQCLIAGSLDDIGRLIGNLECLIAKKQAIRQGMMQQLLTGKTRLLGFIEPWTDVRLGEVAQFGRGMGLPKSAVIASGQFPCIHYGELFTQYGAEIRSIQSRTNDVTLRVRSSVHDVLMPTSDVTPRGLAKASSVHTDGVILGGDILIIRADASRLFGPFLANSIRQNANQVLQLVRGSTVFHLYASDMKNFKFQLPPLDEQRNICTALRDAESEIAALCARLVKARAVKQGMMQELLTGRTRLPVDDGAA